MKTIVQPVKGTRDYYPEAMAVRTWLYENMRQVSESFGYQEYEGPLLEPIELYAVKSGDELVKEQSFFFEDRGGNLITLRPELTPTLVRMIAQRQNQLTFPLRWWSYGPFWRYERPQKGRTREFFQWNIDLIGVGGPAADAELLAIIASFFRKVNLSPRQALILINNRQLLESEIESLGINQVQKTDVFRLIDRKDKMRPSEWEAYAKELGISQDQIIGLNLLLTNDKLWKKSSALNYLFQYVKDLGVEDYIRFAPNIVRGLDYYTGTVFEAQAQVGEIKRSILGGGRYDNLLSDVGGEPMPAVGFAMGDLVISLVLDELGLIPKAIMRNPAPVFVSVFDKSSLSDSLVLTADLRQTGLNVICYAQDDKLTRQLKYADRVGAQIVVLLGPDEIANQSVTLKDLINGEQYTVSREEVAQRICQLLDKQSAS